MSARKKSAVQKRDEASPPLVKVLTEAKGKSYPPGAMLIASPIEIGNIVKQVPAGRVITLQTLRDLLARKFQADYTCALTTGIFLRILAEAAEEEGSTVTWPYWRVVRADGRLIDKLPGGEHAQAKRLEEEGVPCRRVGSNGWKVKSVV